MNKDDDGAFLVDGIVEDLITEFSMIKEIEILSRQTCFDYRNKNYSLEEYKDKFDVDYIVSGSMRSLNERLRISVELSEMDEGNIIWGNKFELDKDDILMFKMRSLGRQLFLCLEILSFKVWRGPTEYPPIA